MPNIPDKRIDSFLSRMDRTSDPNGCWLWTGSRDKRGYGLIHIGGRQHRCSRVAYEYFTGKSVHGLMVCHHCDNPPCCNPDHLFLGTQSDNMRDCVEKGRFNKPRGEGHSAAKLNEAQAREAYRLRREEGRTIKSIAAQFGVHPSTINGIVYGRNWPDLDKSDRPAVRTGERGRPAKAGIRIEATCPICGTSFQFYKSNPHVYCSRSCAGYARARK